MVNRTVVISDSDEDESRAGIGNKDPFDDDDDVITSEKYEKNKSKKKHKRDSSLSQQIISNQFSVVHDTNPGFDNEVDHADKGQKDNDKLVEEKKKSKKKKRKEDLFSDQLGEPMQSAVGDEHNDRVTDEVKHDAAGKKEKAESVEVALVEKKSKKKREDLSSAQLGDSMQSAVCEEHNDRVVNDVIHDNAGKSKKVESVDDAPVGKKKSKKKRKESRVDNKSDAFVGGGVEHSDEGKRERVISIESDPIERRKSEKKHKDQQEDMKDAELMEKAPSEKMKSKKKHKDGFSSAQQDKSVDDARNASSDNGVEHADKGNKRKATSTSNDPVERKKSKKKHKGASMQSPAVDDSNACTDKEIEHANKRDKKKTKVADNPASDATLNKSKKKVRFSGKDDVFTLPADSNLGSDEEDNLVRGKRFTKEEDEVLKQAVFHYIAKHNLGEEGLDMVLNSKKHKEFRGCWKEIGAQIPYRPYTACYYRVQVLFRRSKTRKWTQEEYDIVLKHQEEKGNKWKDVAEELGKHRWHVKDTWRRIQMRNVKKGHWSQQEYQKLFDLVNRDLQAKVFEEKHSKHGMLRDNIPWTAVSEEVSTRTQASCCTKWYNQLMSRMVAEGVWADVDDYVLISELYSLDANCIEDVDWDNILENRSGDLSRKRWNQMVLHIGHHGNKSFSEQVEILAQRYCPHLLAVREDWDNKPRVP